MIKTKNQNSSQKNEFWKKCLKKFNKYLKNHSFKDAVKLVANDFNLKYEQAYEILFPPD